MKKRSLNDVAPDELRGAVVLVRADLNVPFEDGAIADDSRIRATLPTLRTLSSAGARVVVVSHLGRPGGHADPAFSLAPVAARVAEHLDAHVALVPRVSGDEVEAAVGSLAPGAVLLLENARFDPRETSGDASLAREWASWADGFVNDAFGAAHRAHASTTSVAREVVARGGWAVAGRLMEAELEALGRTLDPERPFVAVVGGAKISGKIDVVEGLLDRVDRLLVGGAMAHTFFLALGYEVGASLAEPDRVDVARSTMDAAGERLVLPVDVRVARELREDATPRVVGRGAIEHADCGGDIGPVTSRMFAREITAARTLVWNGPMGVFELPPFAEGTYGVASAVAAATDAGALSIIGGGDSVSAIRQAGVVDRVSHVSTGGGASLEFLAGRELPGVAALMDA